MITNNPKHPEIFLTLLEPYEGFDNLFFELFGEFPKVRIPCKCEQTDEHFMFRERVEEFLDATTGFPKVELLMSENLTGHFHSRVIPSLDGFDYSYEEFETFRNFNYDHPQQGNYWAISSHPFSSRSDLNPYDNDDFYIGKFSQIAAKPEIANLDTNVKRFGGGNVRIQDVEDFERLPDSGYREYQQIEREEGNLTHSELRIVDRLSKTGEAIPYINENFEDLTDEQKVELFEAVDDLLETSANDAAVLSLLKGGYDEAKSFLKSDLVKAIGKAATKVAKSPISIGKGAYNGAKSIAKSLSAEETLKRKKAKIEAEESKKAAREELSKLNQKEKLETQQKGAVKAIEKLNPEKLAKEDTKEQKKKEDADKLANTIKQAVAKLEFNFSTKPIDRAKENLNTEIEAAKEELAKKNGSNNE